MTLRETLKLSIVVSECSFKDNSLDSATVNVKTCSQSTTTCTSEDKLLLQEAFALMKALREDVARSSARMENMLHFPT